MAATLYALEAVEQTINNWIEAGGEISTVEEGVLGWGLTICHGEGLRTAIIKEVPLNEWSSAHTIRIYNKMPKKYQAMLDNLENQEDEEESNTMYHVLADVWNADEEEYCIEMIYESKSYESAKRRFDSVSAKLDDNMVQVTLEKDDGWETEKLLKSVLTEDGVYTTDDF